MAEAYLRHFAADSAEVFSAGIEAHGLNPRAVAAMQEDGINISNQTSNKTEDYDQMVFDFVITVCDNAKEHCPVFPGKAQKFHHSFPDPAKAKGTDEEIKSLFREVRLLIKAYCREFVEEYL